MMRIHHNTGFDDPVAQRFRTGQELVPLKAPKPVAAAEAADAAEDTSSRTPGPPGLADVRSMSPREIADISMELYANGVLTWDEYSMLAFQPELHPDYDKTVGALTGEKADPDRQRDQLAEWENRLNFELKYNSQDEARVGRTKHIVAVLRQIDQPTDLVV